MTTTSRVAGTHLSAAHGMTIDEILGDGFAVSARVPMSVETNDDANLVRALAECASGVGAAFARLRPDLLVVLGDRYELLPAASAATVLRIPIAHIPGGDVTEGAIDNQVRHALTKLAYLHLAGTQEAADRIVRMGEDPDRVFVTGEPGLDEFVNAKPIPREKLARDLGLDVASRWMLFTYHPETLAGDGVDEARVRNALALLAARPNLQTILTAANADRGGDVLNRLLQDRAAAEPTKFRFIASLGHKRFVAVMREAHCLVGNSSAGIVEAASVPLPAIDIGDRQRGRMCPHNVIHVDGDKFSLERALERADQTAFRDGLRDVINPYGDGHSAERIKKALDAFLAIPTTTKAFTARTFPPAARSRNLKALEVGCGPGANIWYLAREGFEVAGIDGSPHAIETARQRLLQEGLEAAARLGDLCAGNFATLPWDDGIFDLVIDIEAIYANPLETIGTVFHEIFRVLQQGGWFFAKMFGPETTGITSGEQFEVGTTLDPSEGPLRGKGVAHAFTQQEIREGLAAFSDVNVDCVSRSDRGGSARIFEWLVSARK